jgi:hypothetical protein
LPHLRPLHPQLVHLYVLMYGLTGEPSVSITGFAHFGQLM